MMRIVLLAAAQSQNTRSLASSWRGAGHDVTIVSLHGDRCDGIPVHELRAGPLGRFGAIALAPRLRALLARVQPDVLVGYHLSSYGLLGALSGFRPYALIAAGGDILPEQYGGPLRRLLMPAAGRFALARADLAIAWAPHLADRMKALGFPTRKIVTLPRGVDLERFQPPAEPRHPADPAVAIVSTRGLQPMYRIDRLIRAVAHLAERGIPARARILGDGPDRARLLGLRDELSLGQAVEIPGAQSYEGVATALRASDVYVSLVPSDGVSCSLLEAMACGVFPVARDIPANRHWIDGNVSGILLESDEPTAVADAIARAWSDPALRAQAARINLERVRARANLGENAARILEALAGLSANSVRRATAS